MIDERQFSPVYKTLIFSFFPNVSADKGYTKKRLWKKKTSDPDNVLQAWYLPDRNRANINECIELRETFSS